MRLAFVVKSVVGFSACVLGGYGLWVAMAPSGEKVHRELTEKSLYVEDANTETSRTKQLYRAIQENASSSRPVWDVRGLDGSAVSSDSSSSSSGRSHDKE